MSLLICTKCKQVPYIEFLPGLLTKIFRCETKLVRHIDLDEFIENYYTLKCQNCSQNKEDNINFCSNKLICNDCLQRFNIKNYITNDSIPNKCLDDDNTKYEFFEPKTHRLYCEYCAKKGCMRIEEFKKSFEQPTISLRTLKPIPYFNNLKERIIKTYEKSKKQPSIINSYLNLSNLEKFINNYSIISPLCQRCKEVYNINVHENLENNSFEISCKCGQEKFNSVIEFEKKIDLIECDVCRNKYNQGNMFLDFLTQDILCEKCLIEKCAFDYIRFNEIPYICSLHKNNYCFFCQNCGKFFCDKCDTEEHNLVEINKFRENIEKKYSIFSNFDWFKKLTKEGYFNLTFNRKICVNKNKNRREKFEKYRSRFVNQEEKNENNFRDLLNELKIDLISNIYDIMHIEMKVSLYSSQIKLEEKILDLQNKVNEMSISLEILFKEFSDKNKISQLLKTRNILQHLFTNMIKKNYNCFEKIEGDFRVLYESYKYLNYEKKNSDEVKFNLISIFERFENLIKSHIKKKVKDSLISNFKKALREKEIKINNKKIKEQFYSDDNEKNNFDTIIKSIQPKIEFDKRMEIFKKVFKNPIQSIGVDLKFKTIDDYNSYLIQQNAFAEHFKKKDIIDVIKNLKEDKYPDNYEGSGLCLKAKLTGNVYFSNFGYVHENTLDKNVIENLLENCQKDDNHQYLFLIKDKSKEFLKNVNCQNDAEFYFITILVNKLISRIGKIIHQNDAIFQFLFYDTEENWNINNYKLIEDKEQKELKFIIDKQNRINSLKNLNFKKLDISSLFNFIRELAKNNAAKMNEFLGIDTINDMKKEIKNTFKELNKIDDIKTEVLLLENKIERFTLFLEKYKDLFHIFPKLKANIIEIIKNDIFTLNEINKFNYIDEREYNYFINMYTNAYTLNIHLIKKRKEFLDNFENIIKNYNSLVNEYFQLEISKRIYNLLLKEINREKDVTDYFEEEKKNTIDIFSKFFKDIDSASISSKKLNKAQKEKFEKEQEVEKQKFEDVIKTMNNIRLADIGSKFEKYFDYDNNSFAQTKMDVVLFLCQNNYI